MKKKKLILVGLGTFIGITTTLAYELKKRERIKSLENTVSGLITTQESMLRYQGKKNEDYEQRLENLVEEVASVYEHLEYVDGRDED